MSQSEAQSTLILHSGAQAISREELDLIPAPPATRTWFPRPHKDVLEAVEFQLQNAGFGIAKARYGVYKDGSRMFATMDLNSSLAEGVVLAVGVRNSNDKSFPMGVACGSRVFVCDNLSFSAEFTGEMSVSRRHTRHGSARFGEALAVAVSRLAQFKEIETKRIDLMKTHEINDEQADSFILRAFEREIISPRILPGVIAEWRTPRHEDFAARTVWSLLNAFTEALKPRLTQPQQYTAATIQLQGMLTRDERYAITV